MKIASVAWIASGLNRNFGQLMKWVQGIEW
jgi:hypothetical protein